MKREAIAIISTDWHIKLSNREEVKDLIRQQIQLGKEIGVADHICLGDVFESRQAQPLQTLLTFNEITKMFAKSDSFLTVIPGNHDKSNYDSYNSFLDPFAKNCTVISGYKKLKSKGVDLHFIPFFNDDIWLKEFEKIEDKSGILLSHRAFDGSVNNDGSEVSGSISPKTVKGFDKVLLGHYHNSQQIGDNIYHLPSIQANNFGEDNNKGFTILYDDGSYELVKSDFKKFVTIKVNLNDVSKRELNMLLKKKYSESDSNIRFKFTGAADKIKSISKGEFESLGIKVETSEEDAEYREIEVKRLNADNILEEFKEWCNEADKDFEIGVKYLKQKLEK